MLQPSHLSRRHRRQILADGEGSKNNTLWSIRAGHTNQAVTCSIRGSTGGKRRQVGRKGTQPPASAVLGQRVIDVGALYLVRSPPRIRGPRISLPRQLFYLEERHAGHAIGAAHRESLRTAFP